MLYSNEWLIEFIGENWIALVILFGIFRSLFPNSKVLNAIGSAFADRFPVFRGK